MSNFLYISQNKSINILTSLEHEVRNNTVELGAPVGGGAGASAAPLLEETRTPGIILLEELYHEPAKGTPPSRDGEKDVRGLPARPREDALGGGGGASGDRGSRTAGVSFAIPAAL